MVFHVKSCFCDSSRPFSLSINTLETHITVGGHFLFTSPSRVPTASLALGEAWSWPWTDRARGETWAARLRTVSQGNQLHDFKSEMALTVKHVSRQLGPTFPPRRFLTPFILLTLQVTFLSLPYVFRGFFLFPFNILTPFTSSHFFHIKFSSLSWVKHPDSDTHDSSPGKLSGSWDLAPEGPNCHANTTHQRNWIQKENPSSYHWI